MNGEASVVITTAVIEKENKYLLVRQAKDRYMEGFWAFPGGKVESGETPDSAVKREIKEETGLNIEIEKLIFTSVIKNEHPAEFKQFPYVAILFYKCRALSYNVIPGDDADEFAWASLEEMKNYKLRPAMFKVIGKLKIR